MTYLGRIVYKLEVLGLNTSNRNNPLNDRKRGGNVFSLLKMGTIKSLFLFGVFTGRFIDLSKITD